MTSDTTASNRFAAVHSPEALARLEKRSIPSGSKKPDEFVVYFAQWHTTFRMAELQALAEIEGVGKMEIIKYDEQVDLSLFPSSYKLLFPLPLSLTND